MVAADPDSDFDLIDNLEPITLRAGPSEAGLAIEKVKRRSITTRELAASGGRYLSGDTRWHIKASDAPVPPLPGWQVVDDDGTVWTALVVERATWDHRWKLVCRNLAVTENLNSRITIQIAVRHDKGEAGDDQPAWADWKTGVLANISLDRIDRRTDAGIMAENAQYSIVLGEQINFGGPVSADASDYRVVDTEGSIYQILSFERHDQIDFLPLLYCERLGPFGSE